MGIETIGVVSKDIGGAGSSITKNFKDLFPERLRRIYIYKGHNLISKNKAVFAREDDLTIISLKSIGILDCLIGSQILTNISDTLEESKTIKEISMKKVETINLTTSIDDFHKTKIDFTQDNLFFTLDKPFTQDNLENNRFDVFMEQTTTPGTFSQLIQGSKSIEITQQILDLKTLTMILIPAERMNNMPSSRISFVDGEIYNPAPIDAKDFEITSIEISSDQTFNPEYGNWVSGTGTIETQKKEKVDLDLDFKSDKPLLPIQIMPYAINGKVQFAIDNFNKYIRMPWLYAKKFLGNDRSIIGYIKQGNTSSWVADLAIAVIDMFKLSHAFSTNFHEYRDSSTGEIKDEKIGGVSLKSLENKEAYVSVDAVLKNWEYSNGLKKKTPEYIRALQILAASSEWISTSFAIGKGLNEFHKTKFDWFLDLNTVINKDTSDINMNLNSLRYDFKQDTKNNWWPNLKPFLVQSRVIIDETDRYVSIPELDNPINLETFISFAGDINLKKSESLKYFVGLDITDPEKIGKFFINQETSGENIETIRISVDSDYNAIKNKPVWKNFPDTLVESQSYNGKKIINYENISDKELILKATEIPNNAFDITIHGTGIKKTITEGVYWIVYNYHSGDWKDYEKELLQTKMEYIVGAVVEYKIKTTHHGVKNKVMTYDKSTWWNTKSQFTDHNIFKRTLKLTDDWNDSNGNPTVKIKKIDRIYLSFFLGNYVDLIFNYQYKNDKNILVKEKILLPRIILPSKNDERITKLGIRL